MSCCLFIALAFLVFATYLRSRSLARLPLPPGPRGSFLYGVRRLLPPTEPWKTYATWAEYFGGKRPCVISDVHYHIVSSSDPLISFRVYNRRTIVLNNATAVRDLLEQRSSIYSDRPKSWMFHEICDRKHTIFNISSLNPRHKQYRKLIHTSLSARGTQEYWPLLQSEAVKLLDGLLTSPDQYERHVRT